jgi:hypothetical protein
MNYRLLIGILILACASAFYAFRLGDVGMKPTPADKQAINLKSEKPPRTDQPQLDASVSAAPTATLSKQMPPVNETSAREQILAAIEEAAVTYDPISLPKIQPYLTHPDPTVREAALDGIVNLGHESGAVLLREAARRLPDGQEASKLKDMADYLELPPATAVIPQNPPALPAAKP